MICTGSESRFAPEPLCDEQPEAKVCANCGYRRSRILPAVKSMPAKRIYYCVVFDLNTPPDWTCYRFEMRGGS